MDIKFDFILKEYDEMFSEKRYYDGRFSSLLSLYLSLITFTVSAVAIVSSIINFQSNILNGAICIIDSISGLLIFISLYFNRINYVKVCRQINSIRNFCLINNCSEFATHNHMYTNDKFPKYFMKNTIHFIFMYFVATLNSLFLMFAIFAFICGLNMITGIVIGVVLAVCTAITQILIVSLVAKKRDNKIENITTF